MSKSKLGQSLMRTIDGGKSKDPSMPDAGAEDAFDQATKNDPAKELSEAGNDSLTSNEPQIGDAEKIISTGEPIEAPIKAKPEKIKALKQKKGGSFVGVVALLLSVIAVGIAGFSVVNQKAGQAAALKNVESMDSAIGNLNAKTDELTAELAGTVKDVQSNSNRLASIDGLRKEIQSLQSTISVMRSEMDSFKSSLETQGVSIDEHQKQINELGDQIKKLDARAESAPKKVRRKDSVKTVNTDPGFIEGAYVASIDLWGTQPSVMLREESGNWVPLTMGDYYKGWRLDDAIGSEAVFRKGSKTKRLTIKE